MQEAGESFEYILISHLNAYAYCPRRFYYEFTLGEMIVNEHVLEGQQLHERVDLPGNRTRDEKVQMHRLYVCAPQLGVVGYCDLLEIEDGSTLTWLQPQKQGMSILSSIKKAKWESGSPIMSNSALRRWPWRKYCVSRPGASRTATFFISVRRDGMKSGLIRHCALQRCMCWLMRAISLSWIPPHLPSRTGVNAAIAL